MTFHRHLLSPADRLQEQTSTSTGTLFRSVSRTAGNEYESTSVQGSVPPINVVYDAPYRIKQLTDNNNPITQFDPLGQDLLDDISKFSAGVGDSKTFNLSEGASRLINRAINDAWDDIVYHSSTAYSAGEWTETAVKVILTTGSATLKKTTAKKQRFFTEGGKQSVRKKTKGFIIHHINPLNGHPLNLTKVKS